LKNNKAPGVGSITRELIKGGGRMLCRKIHTLMESVCGRKNRGLRSGILLSYAQYIKRDTRWSVVTTEEFHS